MESATVQGLPAAVNRAGRELTIRPGAAVEDRLRKGRTFTTVVRYSGSPQAITDADDEQEGWLRAADGAVALGEPTGSMAWFPGNHHPGDKAAYDIGITVPEPLAAVSNGELVSRRTVNGRTVYRWGTAEPMASCLATVAGAVGRLAVRREPAARGELTGSRVPHGWGYLTSTPVQVAETAFSSSLSAPNRSGIR
ncbi:Peptidase family M1 [Streptomyces sp. ADI98-10]|nr:Peptidase family M1 [Streptomyces sp. ADI98-10]